MNRIYYTVMRLYSGVDPRRSRVIRFLHKRVPSFRLWWGEL